MNHFLVDLYFLLAAFGRLAVSNWNIVCSLSGSEREAKGADSVHSHMTLFKRFPSFSTREVIQTVIVKRRER